MCTFVFRRSFVSLDHASFIWSMLVWRRKWIVNHFVLPIRLGNNILIAENAKIEKLETANQQLLREFFLIPSEDTDSEGATKTDIPTFFDNTLP